MVPLAVMAVSILASAIRVMMMMMPVSMSVQRYVFGYGLELSSCW